MQISHFFRLIALAALGASAATTNEHLLPPARKLSNHDTEVPIPDPFVVEALGKEVFAKEDYPHAEELFNQAITLNKAQRKPSNPDTYMALAQAQLIQGKYSTAIETLRTVIKLRRRQHLPGDADSYYYLGFCQSKLGKYEKARGSLLTAIEIRRNQNLPENAEDYSRIGITHYRENNFKEALPYLTKALDLYKASHQEPWQSTLHITAETYRHEGNYTMARQMFCEARYSTRIPANEYWTPFDSRFQETYSKEINEIEQKAKASLQEKDYTAAEAGYQQIIKLAADGELSPQPGYFGLSDVDRSRWRYPRAIKHFVEGVVYGQPSRTNVDYCRNIPSSFVHAASKEHGNPANPSLRGAHGIG